MSPKELTACHKITATELDFCRLLSGSRLYSVGNRIKNNRKHFKDVFEKNYLRKGFIWTFKIVLSIRLRQVDKLLTFKKCLLVNPGKCIAL